MIFKLVLIALTINFSIRGKISTHDFLVWIRTGFNPADVNRFRSHARKVITEGFFERYNSYKNTFLQNLKFYRIHINESTIGIQRSKGIRL